MSMPTSGRSPQELSDETCVVVYNYIHNAIVPQALSLVRSSPTRMYTNMLAAGHPQYLVVFSLPSRDKSVDLDIRIKYNSMH